MINIFTKITLYLFDWTGKRGKFLIDNIKDKVNEYFEVESSEDE
jgi:hypothetical protein